MAVFRFLSAQVVKLNLMLVWVKSKSTISGSLNNDMTKLR